MVDQGLCGYRLTWLRTVFRLIGSGCIPFLSVTLARMREDQIINQGFIHEMRSISLLPIILTLMTIAGFTAASTTSEVIKLRQGNFKEIGGAFKTINDELKSRGPDMNSVRPAADDLATRSALANEHFPEGSGPESGVETRAKAAIWEDREQFMSLMDAMAVAATDLKNAVAARDLAEMRQARDDLGNSCKSCHDDFRVPD